MLESTRTLPESHHLDIRRDHRVLLVCSGTHDVVLPATGGWFYWFALAPESTLTFKLASPQAKFVGHENASALDVSGPALLSLVCTDDGWIVAGPRATAQSTPAAVAASEE